LNPGVIPDSLFVGKNKMFVGKNAFISGEFEILSNENRTETSYLKISMS